MTLNQPASKLKTVGDHRFSVVAPKLWNALPSDLKEEADFKVFKWGLKTHLFLR